jgi:hypothetical protein
MDSKNIRQAAIDWIRRVVTAHPISTTTSDFLHIECIDATRYCFRILSDASSAIALRLSQKKSRIRSYREKYHQAFDILLGCCFSRCKALPAWTPNGQAAAQPAPSLFCLTAAIPRRLDASQTWHALD